MVFSDRLFQVRVYTWAIHAPPSLDDVARGMYSDRVVEAGELDIPQDSWLWKASPEVVRLRHVCLEIREMEGYHVGNVFINSRAEGKRVANTGLYKSNLKSKPRCVIHSHLPGILRMTLHP